MLTRPLVSLLLGLLSSSAMAQSTEHVLLISVDGLHAGHLARLMTDDLVGDFASFQRFVDEGSTTFNARTDYTHTNTAPNHTCMVTGRPVLQPFGRPNTVHHGYTFNSTPDPSDTYHNSGNPNLAYVASAFDVAHDHGLLTGSYVSKPKLLIINQSYGPTTGAPDLVLPDDGQDKIDLHVMEPDLSVMNAALLADLATSPAAFNFVHYNAPDLAGHDFGWGSSEWDDSVRQVADRLGEVFAAVETIPVLVGNTTLILTADHGGVGTSHSDTSDPEVYTIPMFLWGPDVAAGVDLYAMNLTTRRDPGDGRPDYNAGYPPIRNGEGGNLALQLLGLPPIPGSMINFRQDLHFDGLPTATPGPRDGGQLIHAKPNPSELQVFFEIELAAAAQIRIDVFDAAGRRVGTAVDRHYGAGVHSVAFDTGGLGAGVYFARMNARNWSNSTRFVVRR